VKRSSHLEAEVQEPNLEEVWVITIGIYPGKQCAMERIIVLILISLKEEKLTILDYAV
jgi:hypothetical protein